MKKAQGLPMNVIIIAAIALLVLVVLSIIFVSNVSNTGKAINNCQEVGGTCRSAAFGCENNEKLTRTKQCYDSNGDVDPTQVCCIVFT